MVQCMATTITQSNKYESCHEQNPPTCDDVVDEGDGHAEQRHQQVRSRQVEDEEVGDGVQVVVLGYDHADECVADHAQHEAQRVAHDEHQGDERALLVGREVGCSHRGRGVGTVEGTFGAFHRRAGLAAATYGCLRSK